MFGLDLKILLISIPITLIALSVHEFAHGFASSKLGDPTPKMQGRLTLNPLAHLDLVGTICMVVTRMFGWAKPVEINPMYYKDRVKGMALVALAGPLSNFILAFLGMFFAYLFAFLNMKIGWNTNLLVDIMSLFTVQNLYFMVFNLIPFPPLDGFKIAGVFIPRKTYYQILQYEQYIMYILMILCLTGVFKSTIGIGVDVVYSFLFNIMEFLFGLFV